MKKTNLPNVSESESEKSDILVSGYDAKYRQDLIAEEWELAHLELDHDNILIDYSDFNDISQYDLVHMDEYLLKIMMNPDNFGWTCKQLFDIDLLPMQVAILKELWYRPFPMLIASRGFGKSFLLGLYSILRALFIQGRKVVITGAGFRQSKIILGYAESIWYKSAILRDICGYGTDKSQGPHHNPDMWTIQIGDSVIKGLPMGNGDKVRGQRSNDLISDEFNSIDRQIFEEVFAGFGVVSQTPVENVKNKIRSKKLKAQGIDVKEESSYMANQLILSGTCGYQFQHFYEYWARYKKLIESANDPLKRKKYGIDTKTNPNHYSIIRVPVELTPPGFMDEQQVQRAKETITTAIYLNEYAACFSKDSKGFFKRSAIETCTFSSTNLITVRGKSVDPFRVMTKGQPDKRYIFAIDTASQKDNFAVIVLEAHENHARIVYCWAVNTETHQMLIEENKKVKGTVRKEIEKDFYAFCTKKIRELIRSFPCIHIAMDAQGGGRTIAEALHNKTYMEEGDQLLWEINSTSPLWDKKVRPTDDELGLHILELVEFANADYTSGAHHGLKRDLEQQLILFPYFDAIEIVLTGKEDKEKGQFSESLEGVLMEIEELKEELTYIEQIPTKVTGRDRWDIPSLKQPGQPKGVLRKDRASALIMAAYAASRLRTTPQTFTYQSTAGGFVGQIQTSREEPANAMLYTGPAWMMEHINAASSFGMIVRPGYE